MIMDKDNLSSLYSALISKGYSVDDLGDENTFRSKMSDKGNRKELYDYVSGRGDFRIGDYDSYEDRLSSSFARPSRGNIPAEGSVARQVVDEYDKSVADGGGVDNAFDPTARMLQLIGETKDVPAKRPSLKETVSKEKETRDQGKRPSLPEEPGYSGNARSEQRDYAPVRLETMQYNPAVEEDKEVDRIYTPEAVTDERDIIHNYRNRFGLTKRGMELGDELGDIQEGIVSKYIEEFKKTPEYLSLAGKKTSTKEEADALNRQVNELFQRQYGERIYNDMMPYEEAYQQELFDRYGYRINDELRALGKKDTKEQVAELASGVDKLLDEKHSELKLRSGSGNNAFNALMGSTAYNRATGKQRRDIGALESARRLLEESQEIIKEAGRKGNTSFVGGLARGAADNFDPEKWAFGLADMADSAYFLNALNKADKGEALTEPEEKLLEASVINMATQAYFSSDLGRGYKAGRVTAESLPFMLEFIANPISSSGSAIAKSLLKFGTKRFGGAAVNKGVSKFAARLLGDSAAAAGMLATTGIPRVVSGTLERLGNNYDYKLDDEGNLKVNKVGGVGAGEALARSFGSTYFENQSEMVFNAFKLWNPFMKAAEKALPGGVNEFMQRMINSKPARLYKELRDDPVFKEIARRAQFHGLPEEYMEEVYNNFANVAMGEMSAEEAFDLDNNIDTFLGLAPTSVAFGLIGLGGMAAERVSNRRKMRQLLETFNDGQKAKFEELKTLSRKDGNKDIREFIKQTMADGSLTPEQKRDEIEYAYELAKSNAIDDMSNEQDPDGKAADDAYVEGAESAPEEHYSFGKGYDLAERSLQDKNPVLFETVRGMLDEGATIAQLRNALGPSVNGEEWNLISDYYNQKIRLDGAVDAAEAEVQEDVDRFSSNLDPAVVTSEDGVQSVTSAMYKDIPVYVVAYNGTNAVIIQDGRKKMVPSKELSDVRTSAKDDIVNSYREQLLASRQSRLENSISHHPKTRFPQPGMTVWNGDTEMVVSSVEDDGTVHAFPAGFDNKTGQMVPKQGSNEVVMSSDEAMELQDIYYDRLSGETSSLDTGTPGAMKVLSDGRTAVRTGISNDGQEVSFDIMDRNGNVVDSDAMPVSDYMSLADVPESGTASAGIGQDIGNMSEKEVENDTRSLEQDDKMSKPVTENVVAPEPVSETSGVIPVDERGNPLYHKVPVDTTLADLLDGTLDDGEVDGFIEANRQEAESGLKKVSAKAPKIGTNKARYIAERNIWQEKVNEAQVRVDYWNQVKDAVKESRIQPGDKTADEIRAMGHPMDGHELAAQMLASGQLPLLREDYMRETGFGKAEASGLFGLFRSKDSGGMTVEEAGEKLMLADMEDGTGFFDRNDANAGRNAILDVLSSVRKRGDLLNYIKSNREAMAERERIAEQEYEEAQREAWAQENFGMGYSDYLVFEEVIDDIIQEKMVPEDVIQEFYDNFANELNNWNNGRTTEEAPVDERGPVSGGSEVSEGILPSEPIGNNRGAEANASSEIGKRADNEGIPAQEGKSGIIPEIEDARQEVDTDSQVNKSNGKNDTISESVPQEKGKLINEFALINPSSSTELSSTPDAGTEDRNRPTNRGEIQTAPISNAKDTKLLSILQTNAKENARKIKMATGWERGADGKWRYKIDDFDVDVEGLARRNSLTPEQRRVTLAEETEDVAREDQIFLNDAFGIPQDKLLYVDKERIQNLIDQQRTILADVDYLDLDSVTKIVESFENPTVEQGKITQAIEDLSSSLHTPIKIARTPDDVTDESAKRAIGQGRMIKAWFDPGTGEVAVYMPNATDVNDAVRSVLHEVVGHKGLRDLLVRKGIEGAEERRKAFDDSMMELYNQLPADVKKEIADIAARSYGGEVPIAMDEYLAEQAEKDVTPSWWGRVVSAVRDLLRRIGINVELSGNDVKYLLWRSRKNLERGNVFSQAEDIVMRNKLGLGEYSKTPEKKENTRFREGNSGKIDPESTIRGLNARIRSLEKTVEKYEDTEELRRGVTDFIRKEIRRDLVGYFNKEDLNSLLVQAQSAKTKKSLERIVMNVKTVVLNARRRKLQRMVDKLLSLKVQDVNGKNMSIAKNVDDSTRRIFSFMKGRISDLKLSGFEEDMTYLRRDSRGKREEISRLERSLSEAKDKEERSRIEGRIADLRAGIDENRSRISELEKESGLIKEQVANAGDIDIDAEIARLNSKMDEAAMGKAAWTLGDSERMAALNIIQGVITGRKYDSQVEDIEIEKQKIVLENSQRYKDRVGEPDFNKRRRINEQINENRRRLVALDRLISDARSMQVKQLEMAVEELNELVSNGKNSLLRRVEEEAARKRDLIGGAIRSVKGKPIDVFDDKAKKENTVKKFFSAPMGSFEYMCKRVNTQTLGKDGFLYKRFVEGPEGVMKAYDTYVSGMKELKERLDAKANEIFGKGFSKIASLSDNIIEGSGVYVFQSREGEGYGVKYQMPLSKGQAMYIYQVWKMADGRTKLELQGFDEESVAQIVDFIGPEYVKFADWVQEDFLKGLREKYNEKYVAMYNTSMADIENYIPLKIRKEGIRQETSLSDDGKKRKTLEEKAGSLINRTFNTNKVDITCSGFDVLWEHGNQMEEWNAYARVRKDLDYILSSTTFRLQLNANVRGSYENFYDAAEVATKTYHPDMAKYGDEILGKWSKGIVGGNIAFRMSTALKQVLSAPAFLGYSQNPKFVYGLLKNSGNLWGSFKWGMENIPSFYERVSSGTVGNEKLDEKSFSKLMDKYIEFGMIPNKMIDAITCAIGARSIYDYRYALLKKSGVAEEEARNQALVEADIYYNATQQSSHPAFLSPMQMSRTFTDRMLTTYQNSNIGYVRRVLSAFYDLTRSVKWKELKQNYIDMYMQEGLPEQEAERKAYRRLLNENRKNITEILLFGWGLNLLWELGSQGLSMLSKGDDDDNMWTNGMSFLLTSPVKGLPGGNLLESVASGYGMNPFLVYDELEKFIRESKYAVDEYGLISPEIAYMTLSKASRYAGVDLEVWGNVYMGAEGMMRDGGFVDDGLINTMYMLNFPKSNRAGVARWLYKDEPMEVFAEKVARASKYIRRDDSLESKVPGAKELTKRKEREFEKQYERLHMTDEEKLLEDEMKIASKVKRKLKELGDDEAAVESYIENNQEAYEIYEKYY